MFHKNTIPAILLVLLTLISCGQMPDGADGSLLEEQTVYPGQIELSDEQKLAYDALKEERPDADDVLLRLAVVLELDDSQVDLLLPVFEELHAALKAIHDEMKAEFESYEERPPREVVEPYMQQIRQLKEEAREEIRPVLTDEQNTAFDELVQQCREKHGDRPPPPPPGE